MQWHANWIRPAKSYGSVCPAFRKTFFCPENVVSAALRITAMGVYEASLNGSRVGDFILAPGWTVYQKRLQVQQYELQIRPGQENELTVLVGKGWYRGRLAGWLPGQNSSAALPAALTAELTLRYPDGHTDTICTDASWQTAESAVRFSELYDGETYDAAFEPSVWTPAVICDGPTDTLIEQQGEPVREQERIAPARIFKTPAGEIVVDFGQNLTGYVEIALDGVKGEAVELSHAEVLDKNGNFYTENYRSAKAKYLYFCKDGAQRYKPKLTFYGFRYIRVDRFPCGAEHAAQENFTAIAVHSDMKRTGYLSCSDPLLNKLFENVIWGQKSNFLDVPTDCPQRDERLGWLNDLTVRAEEAMFNFEMYSFYRKFVTDMLDAQGKKTGAITDTVPYVRYGSQPADPVCSSFLLLPWMLYQQYGDKQTLRSAYPGLRAWTMYLTRQREDGIVCYSYYGDWASPVGGSVRGSYGSGAVSSITPGRLISTGYLYLNCMLLAQMADVLMLEEDHAYFRELAAQTCSALNRAFLNREGGFYAGNSQAANTFMLYLGVVPEQFRAQVLQNLIRDIQQHDTHVTTGNLCTRYILDVLADNGEIDLAYALVTQTTYPSWGYMLACGATTVWERWEYVDSGELVGMASHDHPMYAAVSGWFYRCLAGLRPDAPAFSRFTLQPYFPRELPEIRCTLHTVKGEIRVEWTQRGGEVRLLVRIPFNASAVWKPTLTLRRLLIDGAPAPDAAEYPLGAGTHSIEFERNDQ